MKNSIAATIFIVFASVTIIAEAKTVCGPMTTIGSCKGDFPRVGIYGKDISIQVSAEQCRAIENGATQVYCVEVAKAHYSLGNVNFGYTKAVSSFQSMVTATHRYQAAEAQRERRICPDDNYRILNMGHDRTCTCIKGRPFCNY